MNTDSSKDAGLRAALSRRDFIKGSAALGVASVGVGLLTGCSAGADEQTVKPANKLPLAEPIAPVAVPAKWDKEADIVVVGTGGGGLTASLLAAQNGASVVTIELNTKPGGNTQESSYFQIWGGSKFQNRMGIPFDPQALFKEYWPLYRNSVDPELFMAMIVRGCITIDWLEDLGVPWDFDSTFTGRGGTGLCWKGSDDGGLTIRMTKKVTDFVYEKAVDAGVDFLFGTPLTALVKDGDTIVGVKAKTSDGDIFIKGNKGVILCAGGCCSNRDMLQKWVPTCAKACGASMASTTDMGDAIRMGIGAGAQTTGYDSFAIFDGGPDWEMFGGVWNHCLYGGYEACLRSPWLRINEQGKRVPFFDNNGVGGEIAATFQGCIEMAQPGNRTYVVFNKGWEEKVPAFAQTGCRRPMTPDMPDIDRAPNGLAPHNWIDGVNNAIERGWIQQADTIEALAEKLGLTTEILTKAVEDWNATCAAGVDGNPITNYKAEWLLPLNEGPFYGAKIGGNVATIGWGLAVDTGMRVMSTEGTPIPGLYAGFSTAGGAWGESGYGIASPLAVNHLSWWGGYVAAETALGLEKA
ncbi:MAG: FAD-binding protein [Coriobacteriia bacterium]